VRGFSAIEAGLRTLPLTATTLLVAPLAGRLLSRVGPRKLVVSGLVLTLSALIELAALAPGSSYGLLVPALVALGVGLSLVLPTCVSVALARTPQDQAGIASGVATTARQLGGALGIAVLASLGAQIARFDFHRATSITGDRVDELVSGGRVEPVGTLLGPQAKHAAADAFVSGLNTAMWIAAAAALAALVVAWHGLPAGPSRPRTAEAPTRDQEHPPQARSTA
jgi:MFS family permease